MTEAQPIEISGSEIAAFAHDAYYGRALAKLQANTFTGFNWWVLVFGGLWFFYRKMPLIGASLSISGALLSFLAVLASGPMLPVTASDQQLNDFLAVCILVGFALNRMVFAAFANRLYLRKAIKTIRSESEHNYTNDDYLAILKERGGPSMRMALFGIAFFFILGKLLGLYLPNAA